MTRDEAAAMAAELDGWTLDGDALKKEFVCADFPGAVHFVESLVPGAEKADHHPDIEIHYKRVTLVYTTHSEGGLTAKDFAGARMADAAFAALAPRR